MKMLRLADFLHSNDFCHYARVSIQSPKPQNIHKHNFHEIFWIADGEGTHWINDEERRLYPGLLTLIKASDCHGFSGNLTMVNIAFPTVTWIYLRKRYHLPDLFSAKSITKREYELPPSTLHDMESFSEELLNRRGRLEIERFLLNLVHIIRSSQNSTTHTIPLWLATALQKIGDLKYFQMGTHAFRELTGRTPEHIARALKLHTGKTPTDFINEARMAYAAGRLVATQDSILNIALNCGIESLGHFYQLFQSTYATTPRAYRRKHQTIVRG